jgi:hypothetical protein
MSSFFDDRVYREYENQLPKRYDEKPLGVCFSCLDDIFEDDTITVIDDKVYCKKCAWTTYAKKEMFEDDR